MLMLSFSVTFVSALDNEYTVDITDVIPIKAKEFAQDRLLPLSNSIYTRRRASAPTGWTPRCPPGQSGRCCR